MAATSDYCRLSPESADPRRRPIPVNRYTNHCEAVWLLVLDPDGTGTVQ